MAITPVTCAGPADDCTVVGRDLASATPAKLLVGLNLDSKYLECDPTGLRVAIRDQPGDINAAALPAPAQGCGNLIRAVNQAGNKGLFAFAPQIHPRGDGTREAINTTVGNYSNISHTISYTNPDTNCARLVSFEATLSTILEEYVYPGPGSPPPPWGAGSPPVETNIPMYVGVMEGLSTIADINGVTVKQYAVTITGRGTVQANNILNDARHAKSVFEVLPGATVQQTWRMRTVRSNGIIASGAGRGFLVFDSWAKVEQGVVL